MLGPRTDNQVSDSTSVQQAGRDIHGISPEQPERMLQKALDALRADLEAKFKQANRADVAERQMLQMRIDEYQRRLADPKAAYDAYIRRIAELESLLEESAIDIGENRLKDAESAMAMDDYSKADAIFAEVQEHDARAVMRSAKAAYGQGLIAEEQVRWADAAVHYSRAARLDPGYETLVKAGEFLFRAGRYVDAIRWEEKLVEIAKSEFGAKHEKTAGAMNNLATNYRAAGRYDAAERLHREALAVTSKKHPDYAAALSNFANLLQDTGRPDDAEALYREARTIVRKKLGEAHPDYAKILNNLASVLKVKSQYEEAELLYRDALVITSKTRGEVHPDYAGNLNNLAELLRVTEQYDEAERLYRKAMAIDCKTLGEEHPEHASRLNNLALLLASTGRYSEAESLFREALASSEVALGAEHPSTQAIGGNLEIFLAERPA